MSSEAIYLNPGERSPIAIKLSYNIFIGVSNPEIYWSVEPVESDTGWVISVIWILALLLAAGWLIHQKGRSYRWILLSLSGIGIIILLFLDDKRIAPDISPDWVREESGKMLDSRKIEDHMHLNKLLDSANYYKSDPEIKELYGDLRKLRQEIEESERKRWKV